MPQLDHFAFLGHATSIYIIIMALTLYFIYFGAPQIFAILRFRKRLAGAQHPGIPRFTSIAIWARRRHYIAMMCHWRQSRVFPNLRLKRFVNLQSLLRTLYHPYWKFFSFTSDNEKVSALNLYTPRLRYFFKTILRGPKRALEVYRIAATKSRISPFFELLNLHWRSYFTSCTAWESHNPKTRATLAIHIDSLQLLALMRSKRFNIFLNSPTIVNHHYDLWCK